MAWNDPNNDGVVTLQREVGHNIVVVTIFAMQIWCFSPVILYPVNMSARPIYRRIEEDDENIKK